MKHIDFNLLSDAYEHGWGAMGVPEKGFYLIMNDRIESLQSYLTRLSVGAHIDRRQDNVICVYPEGGVMNHEALTNEMMFVKLYDTAARTYGNRTVAERTKMKVGDAIIDKIYGGEYDMEAFVSGMAAESSSAIVVMDNFIHDLVEYHDDKRSVRSTAAFQAYQYHLLSEIDEAERYSDTGTLMPKGIPTTLKGYLRRVVESQPEYVPGCPVISKEIADSVRHDLYAGQGKRSAYHVEKFHALVSDLELGVFRDRPDTLQSLTSQEFIAYSDSLYAPKGQEPSDFEVFAGLTPWRKRPKTIPPEKEDTYLDEIRQRVLSPITYANRPMGSEHTKNDEGPEL